MEQARPEGFLERRFFLVGWGLASSPIMTLMKSPRDFFPLSVVTRLLAIHGRPRLEPAFAKLYTFDNVAICAFPWCG